MSDDKEITPLGIRVNGPLASENVTVAPTGAPKNKWDYDANMELIDAILETVIAGGYPAPVTSVAGRTGNVVLAESDITGLVADLALKASSLTPSFSGTCTYEYDNLGSNTDNPPAVPSLLLQNDTPATVTISQNPGSILFKGHSFNGNVDSGLKAIAEIIAAWGNGISTSANLTFSMLPPTGKGSFVIFKNNVPATAGQNTSTPAFSFVGYYWDGTASQQETWEFFSLMGSGANPTSIFTLAHFGTTGQATFDLTGGGLGGTTYKVLIPNVAALDNSTNAANTKYVDTAVGVEKTRATAAEGVVAAAVVTETNRATAAEATKQATSAKDTASGYPGLDADTQLKCSELPSWLIEGVNNSIVRGPVDASGNPAYVSVATVSTVATATVLGATTNLEAYIDGLYQKVADNTLTVVLNNGGASAPKVNFIYLKKDTANKQLISTDVGVTTNAPVFGNNQTAPATTLATTTNPVFWFDPTVNQWKKATSSGGAFAVTPIIPLAVCVVDSTGTLLGSAYWGPRWTPFKVMEICGQGSDGSVNLQTGTSVVQGFRQYTSFVCSGGNYNESTASGTLTAGVMIYSQAPIIVCNGGTVNADGAGPNGGSGTTQASGAGAAANTSSGMGGCGGGGGGSSTAIGAIGGSLSGYYTTSAGGIGGGAAGTTAPTGGGNGSSNPTIIPLFATSYFIGLSGTGGGGGAGDNASASTTGGAGGNGGGMVLMRAPGLLVTSGSNVSANGTNGSTPATGTNGSGGGGGGGGFVLAWVGYLSNAGTITANGGTGGAKKGSGTGTAGGTGGQGKVSTQRVF